MVTLSRFDLGVLILRSQVAPAVGIVAGMYHAAGSERPGDILGALCIILGIIYFVIWRSVSSLA